MRLIHQNVITKGRRGHVGMKEIPAMKAHAIAIAARAATEAHWGQTRKDKTTPYIVHPERVAACVGRCGGDHVGMIAAWLHDNRSRLRSSFRKSV